MRLAISLLVASVAFAQQRPVFDVATIRPSTRIDGVLSTNTAPDGHYTASNVPLWNLIRSAHGLKELQLSGGPAWIHSQGFDIQAQPATPVAREQSMLMLQSLIEDRFHLKFHRETKDQPGYALKLAKPEPKLQPAAEGKGQGRLKFGDMDTPSLALSALCEILEFELDRPIVNQTGVNGPFAFKLQWASERIAADATSGKPSLFTALQEQLGLKLESARVPVEMFIIDSVDQPTEN